MISTIAQPLHVTDLLANVVAPTLIACGEQDLNWLELQLHDVFTLFHITGLYKTQFFVECYG